MTETETFKLAEAMRAALRTHEANIQVTWVMARCLDGVWFRISDARVQRGQLQAKRFLTGHWKEVDAWKTN